MGSPALKAKVWGKVVFLSPGAGLFALPRVAVQVASVCWPVQLCIPGRNFYVECGFLSADREDLLEIVAGNAGAKGRKQNTGPVECGC